MALLERVQKLNNECLKQLIQFYESPEHRFPVEVRNLFAKEIEEAVCGCLPNGLNGGKARLDPNNADHYTKITTFLSNLVEALENQVKNGTPEEVPFFTKQKLADAVIDFRTRIANNALEFFQAIRECIFLELDLVKPQSPAESFGNGFPPIDGIMDNVQSLRNGIIVTGELLARIVTEQESFEINCNEKQTMDDYLLRISSMKNPNGQTQNFEKGVKAKINIVESKLQENLKNLMSLTQSFESSVEWNLSELSKLQTSVQSKIQAWKYEQQLLANGLVNPNSISVTKLQLWCEELADLMWMTRQQLKEAERLQNHNPAMNASATPDGIQTSVSRIPGFLEGVTQLLSELLCGSFLVENQPPQVMKLGTRFPNPVTVSLLVGSRLHVQMTSPTVTTCIINENQAIEMQKWNDIKKGTSGDISNGSSKLDFNRDAKRLLTNFRSMQVKRIARADKKSTGASESVMEEKFCLLFESNVMVGDLSIRIWTRSMPVVVISHGSQEAQAVATITWDNAFGAMGRIPFQVPNRVLWTELAKFLSLKFETALGRGLNEEHLRCLKQKAFRNVSHSDHITWNEFCKDHLPDRHFSFWDWLFAALRVMERKDTNLKELWNEGLIFGFVERQTAENLLMNHQPGTFLLRFSDSLAGAITIAWIHEDSNVYLVNPFQLHDLTKEKLADSIHGLDHMKFLYPNHPKDVIFAKHYSPPKPVNGPVVNPYVKPKMVLDVPGSSICIGTPSSTPNRTRSNSWAFPGPSMEFTTTPSSFQPQYPWLNESAQPVPFYSDSSSQMTPKIRMNSGGYGGASPDSGIDRSPIMSMAEETDPSLLPNFPALGGPFGRSSPAPRNNSLTVLDNQSRSMFSSEEAMQITMEDQFSDLLTIIHSDLPDVTYM